LLKRLDFFQPFFFRFSFWEYFGNILGIFWITT